MMRNSTDPSEKVSDWISTTSSSPPLVASSPPELEILLKFCSIFEMAQLVKMGCWAGFMIINHLGAGGR